MPELTYPISYNDKMTDAQQDQLMYWFDVKNRVYKRGEKAQLSHISDVVEDGESLCKRTQHEIDTAIEILETIGIYIGYSWYGHRDEYFLITAQDAEDQAEYLDDLNEE